MSGRYYKYGPEHAIKKSLAALSYSPVGQLNDSAKRLVKKHLDEKMIQKAIASKGTQRNILNLKNKKADKTLEAFKALLRKN